MKTAKTSTRTRSLSEKIRSVRSHIRSMDKHAAKAAVAGRMSAISAWHVGRGLAITRISADMGSEWPAFCLAKFGMPARRASNIMKLSEAFASPDDIPDECRSITSAVKAARAAIRGMKPVCLKRVSNKCIEKGMKDWVVKNWESLDRGERSKLGIPYHSQDEVWAEVPVRGKISGKPVSGIIDLLFRHVVKNHWSIVEAKAGLAKEEHMSKLLLYDKLWRLLPGTTRPNHGMRVDKVFMCERATPGLKSAARREGVVLVEWGYTFKLI